MCVIFQVMEALGGDQLWIDRFIGYHSAVVYYWILLLMYAVAPAQSYGFSELIEIHATMTYGKLDSLIIMEGMMLHFL